MASELLCLDLGFFSLAIFVFIRDACLLLGLIMKNLISAMLHLPVMMMFTLSPTVFFSICIFRFLVLGFISGHFISCVFVVPSSASPWVAPDFPHA